MHVRQLLDKENVPFVHSLVFRCDGCREPIPIILMSEVLTLEKVDGHAFDLLCKCGWLKRALGMEAVVHNVAPWEWPSPDRTPQIPSDIIM